MRSISLEPRKGPPVKEPLSWMWCCGMASVIGGYEAGVIRYNSLPLPVAPAVDVGPSTSGSTAKA